MEYEDLVEKVAALEHEQWAHWTRYMLAHLTPENIERWQRQCETPYANLPEIEKDSDRDWAKRHLAAIAASGTYKVVRLVVRHREPFEFDTDDCPAERQGDEQ